MLRHCDIVTLRHYDIVALHNDKSGVQSSDDRQNEAVRCGKANAVQDGFSLKSAGALLFTTRTPIGALLQALRRKPLSLTIGHWLETVQQQHNLKVGSLCLSSFVQLNTSIAKSGEDR